MALSIIKIKKEKLFLVETMWTKLNEIHINDSRHFKDYFSDNSFNRRFKAFMEIDDKNLLIEMVVDETKAVGYCISSKINNAGEIDSLYVEDSYRKFSLGKQLMKNAVKWLKTKNCSIIQVAVADGHESVLGFYEKLGFYPRKTYLQMK